MVEIEAITEEDRDLIREVFYEDKSVYVTNTAKFEVDGDTLRCISSLTVNPNMSDDLVSNELRIMRIREIAEGIGYKFKDLRKEINN